MQDRSVTRAGNRIGLSQPAMSHALNRLRHMLKDELFVRTPGGALSLEPRLRGRFNVDNVLCAVTLALVAPLCLAMLVSASATTK